MILPIFPAKKAEERGKENMDNMKKKASALGVIREGAILTAATAIIAAAVFFFLVPSHTSISSISGLGIVLQNVIPVPLSVITMVLNVALLLIGFLTCGREFGVKTVYTSIMLPAGVDGDKLLKVAADECGIIFAGGQDHYKGRMVRFGHMGWVDWADALAGLHALAHGLRASGGFSASRDYLETALSAYRRALDVEPGRVIPDVRS